MLILPSSNKLAAVIGVVGEVVTTMAITVAREFKTENIVLYRFFIS